MSLSKLARSAVCAVFLLLPALASAYINYPAVFRLTNTGQILGSSSGVIHTDANIRFIHAARNTLYKVLKDGSIYGVRICDGSIGGNIWNFLGKDANITLKQQLSGGDNAFPGGCVFGSYSPPAGTSIDGFFDAPLYKLSGTSIARWTGSGQSWVSAGTGFSFTGGYKFTGNATWAGFSPPAVFSLAGKTVGQVSHRGGFASWDHVLYTQFAVDHWDVKSNATTIDSYNGAWYIDDMATYGTVSVISWGIDDPELGHSDEIKQVWQYRSGQMVLVHQGYVKDIQTGENEDTGQIIFVMADDGLGNIQRYTCQSTSCGAPVSLARGGKTIVQMVVVPTYFNEENN